MAPPGTMTPRAVDHATKAGQHPVHAAKLGPRDAAKALRPHDLSRMTMRLHGVWYDFSDFKHPGGPVALGLGQGRDVTALFESHHMLVPGTKLDKVLAKYRVSDAEQATLHTMDLRDEVHPFVWPAGGSAFANELKAIEREYFVAEAKRRGVSLLDATKTTPMRWAQLTLMFLAFACSLPAFVRGEAWTLLWTPIASWVWMVNYWHDATHFALSRNWRINAYAPYLAPWFSSPTAWYHQHVIGHHAYPNIAHKDPDLAHAPQLLREHRSMAWKPLHKGQQRRIPFVWTVSLGVGLNFLTEMKAILSGLYNRSVAWRAMSPARMAAHAAGRLWVVFLLYVWPFLVFPLPKAIVWAVVPIVVYSFFFMANTQVNHLTPDNAHASNTDFFKHQIVTGHNFGVGKWWCYLFSGGLNMQIEHHLFPNVNHCHLIHLAPKVKALCAKHNVYYHESSGYIEALRKHVQHTYQMGVAP